MAITQEDVRAVWTSTGVCYWGKVKNHNVSMKHCEMEPVWKVTGQGEGATYDEHESVIMVYAIIVKPLQAEREAFVSAVSTPK